MKVVSLEETTLTLPELTELAKDGPVILTRNGQPLLSVKDVSGSDWESVSLASIPRFMAIIEESRRSHRERGGVALDDIRQELGIKKIARRRSSAKEGKEES
ncbi:MAG: hypothetical protein ACHRXM_19530 [Isosphaerales bacterium]